MSPRSVKSLRRLANAVEILRIFRVIFKMMSTHGMRLTATAQSEESKPLLPYLTHAGTTRRRPGGELHVLSRLVRSVFPEITPIRCNRTQCGDRHPATWVKWRQREQALCVFRQNERRRSPRPAPKSDAPRQVLPQTWRRAAGFGIGHLKSKWHPASAAGRRTARWFPSVRGGARPGMHAQYTGCERTARAPSPVAIKRRRLAANPRRTAGIREQACQGRGRKQQGKQLALAAIVSGRAKFGDCQRHHSGKSST
jgi:hypothetical protein